MMNKPQAISLFIDKGYLPSPDIFDAEEVNVQELIHLFNQKFPHKDKPIIIHKDFLNFIHTTQTLDLNWLEFEKSRVMHEKGKTSTTYTTFLELLQYPADNATKEKIDTVIEEVQHPDVPSVQEVVEEESQTVSTDTNVILVNNYKEQAQQRNVQDFVSYFKSRYSFLSKLLQQRPELRDVVSISRATRKTGTEKTTIIGLVYDKRTTANGNLLFTVEDITGSIKILVNQNKPELFAQAEHVCVDEVIGVVGNAKHTIMFTDQLIFPDIPAPSKEPKKSDDDIEVAFISDIHFGSKDFLPEQFQRFIDWINGKSKNKKEQERSQKIKYLFVVGDVVDGVGVYPGQDKDLEEHRQDIRSQYQQAYEAFSQIRQDITIIMCPGQHDAVRIAEPQPCINEIYAKDLCSLPNLIRVSNPSMINVHSNKNFEGFNVLLYHGASFHYYIDNIPQLRKNLARDNPGQVLRALLRKRHLAPSHTSTVYAPYTDDDPLLIKQIPDIIVSGDMHKSDLSYYNGVVVINSSCWQGKTDFQEKTGNNPDPCKLPLFNLRTRALTMLNFNDLTKEDPVEEKTP